VSYFVSPVLGMSLPNAGTAQAFEIAVQNANMALIEGGFTSDRTAITAQGTAIATLQGASGRGTLADYKVATPAALQALSTMVQGDTAVMVGDGTNFSLATFQYNGSKWAVQFVSFLLSTTAAFAAFTTYLALGTNTNLIQSGGQGVDTTNGRQLYYDGAVSLWYPVAAHQEFTSSAPAVANATNTLGGTFTADAANSNTTSLVTITATGELTIAAPGVYTIEWLQTGQAGFVSTGRTFYDISTDNADANPICRVELPVNTAFGGCVSPAFVVTAANTNLWFWFFQTSGGTKALTGRAKITKIG
jgi:hypothetical protein